MSTSTRIITHLRPLSRFDQDNRYTEHKYEYEQSRPPIVGTTGLSTRSLAQTDSYNHRQHRNLYKEKSHSPPPPTPTVDKGIQCELKKFRKSVREATRCTSAGKVVTHREYNEDKWIYSDQERRDQESALASLYPNLADLPLEHVLTDQPAPVEFRYTKWTKQIPVSSMEQRVFTERKVDTNYDKDFKVKMFAYKPGMGSTRGKSKDSPITTTNTTTTTNGRPNEVIYSQVDMSKKRAATRPPLPSSESPLPDYSDNEPRHRQARFVSNVDINNSVHSATRPYLITTNQPSTPPPPPHNSLRSRSASPLASKPVTTISGNKSTDRLQTYQYGFQNVFNDYTTSPSTRPSSRPSFATPNTTTTTTTSNGQSPLTFRRPLTTSSSSHNDPLNDTWSDGKALPASGQPAPLQSGNLLRQLDMRKRHLSSDSKVRRMASSSPSPSADDRIQARSAGTDRQQITYATLGQDGLLSRTKDVNYQDEAMAYTLDRKQMADRRAEREYQRSMKQQNDMRSANSLRSVHHYRNGVGGGPDSYTADHMLPPLHTAPSPPPPPPPPQFSDHSPRSMSYRPIMINNKHEPDYLQPKRPESRISLAYGSDSKLAQQRRSQSLSRSNDHQHHYHHHQQQQQHIIHPITSQSRSPVGSVRRLAHPLPPNGVGRSVIRSSSLSGPHGSVYGGSRPPSRADLQPFESSSRGMGKRVLSHNRIPVYIHPNVYISPPPPPPNNTLIRNRRLSASVAEGINNNRQSPIHHPSLRSTSGLYRSSEQVNRLAGRTASSLSIGPSAAPSKTSAKLASKSKPPAGSGSALKRAQSIPKNAKLPLFQKIKNKFTGGNKSKE